MARRLRRYKFSGLPRLSREQVAVSNALLSYLPQTPFEHDFKDRLRAAVEPLVHADVDLWFDNVSHVEPGGLEGVLCDPTCSAVIGMLPTEHKVIAEFDLTVAQQAIDRMLGGKAEDVDGQRALSEIEEGVFSFIVLKILALMQEDYASESQLSLKLGGIYGSWDELAPRVDGNQEHVCVAFKLFFDLAVGFVRLYLPVSLVQKQAVTPQPLPGPALSRRLRRLAELSPRIGALKVNLCVEVGAIPFSVADLDALDAGDIILIEDPQVRLVDGALSGQVNSHVGEGRHGVIAGTLMVGEAGAYEVAIDQVLPGAQPEAAGALAQESEMDEEHANEMSRAPDARGAEHAARARTHLAERAGRVDTRPLPHGDEESLVEEHSEGEYDEEGYDEEDEGGYEEPLAESAGMLDDVAVAMVVELGRVSVSAADIMHLRPGQVIELSRGPGDPVDLVVDGKRLGKGELVEIEGELGVRILELGK
jgi:flagellar motor switch protein FliM